MEAAGSGYIWTVECVFPERVEYFTSYYMELTPGKKWWDYSGYYLNLNGRICAEGFSLRC